MSKEILLNVGSVGEKDFEVTSWWNKYDLYDKANLSAKSCKNSSYKQASFF